LLDTFEAERRAFALRLVHTTDRFFNVAAAEGHLAEIVRTRLLPVILPQVVNFEWAREYIFRTLSQITLNYWGKGLDQGQTRPLHGGDRLRWVKLGEGDNYKAFKHIGWQVHVYGVANNDLRRWCEERHVPLEVCPWSERLGHAGLCENALYLMRPDTYVALTGLDQSIHAIEQYFDKVQIKP
jgi:hypothetical protein